MERYAVPVLAEIDTRALVRHLRTHGVMRGVISTSRTEYRRAGRKRRGHPQDGWNGFGARGLNEVRLPV
jgi:carbamoylphosphate synthase small subunit